MRNFVLSPIHGIPGQAPAPARWLAEAAGLEHTVDLPIAADNLRRHLHRPKASPCAEP